MHYFTRKLELVPDILSYCRWHLSSPSPMQRLTTVYLLKGMSVWFPYCTLKESGSSSNSLILVFINMWEVLSQVSVIYYRNVCTISGKTEDKLLLSKTLMRHFLPICQVTLCFFFVDRLTVYDSLLNTSSSVFLRWK